MCRFAQLSALEKTSFRRMSESLSVSDQQCLVGFPLLERGCHFMALLRRKKKTISRYRKTRAHTQTRLAPHNHHLKLKNKTNDFVTFHDQRYLVGFPRRLKHRYRLPFSVTMCKITLFI